MKVAKKILVIITTIIIINVALMMSKLSSEEAATAVNLSIVTQPNIDIVLAKSKTGTNLENFKPDLLNALVAREVQTNYDRVRISAVETVTNQLSSEDVNVDEIINSWQTVGAPTWSSVDGKIYSNSPSCSLDQTDNPGVHWNPSKALSWWGTGLIDPDGNGVNQIRMTFTMVTGGNLNEGVCFNVTQNDDGSLNGYFVSICNHGNTGCRLWRFDHYTLDQSFYSGINRDMCCRPTAAGWTRDGHSWEIGHTTTYGNDSFTCLAGWTTGKSNVEYDIQYKNNKITIKVFNEIVAEIVDTTYTEGTYGFWGNNCETAGLMYINNIKIETVRQKIKRLEEVLREPDWRENSIKVLVNVDDYSNVQLTQPTKLGELLTRMINDEIYYCRMG